MNPFLKYTCAVTLSIFTFASYGQKVNPLINKNLNCFSIAASYEDTVNFRTKNIYAVRSYKAAKRGSTGKNIKVYKGKPFTLFTYTTYLPDGRRRYKVYTYDHVEDISKYYYTPDLKNLVLIAREEVNKAEHYQNLNYSWLFYDKNDNLVEDFSYSVSGQHRIKYDAYTKYNIAYLKDETRIKVAAYNSDTTARPIQTFIFSSRYLTKDCPEYQSKWQKFIPMNGVYSPIETKGYIFQDRNVDFTYDDKGFLTSEIWHMPATALENKTTYAYSKDYKERTEQRYQMKGTQMASKTVRKYDQFNNLISEQYFESDGKPLQAKLIEYVYDKNENWVEMRIYEQSIEKGVYGKKKLLTEEIREIDYYKPDQAPMPLQAPVFPQKAKEIKGKVPGWSVGAAQRKKALREESDME